MMKGIHVNHIIFIFCFNRVGQAFKQLNHAFVFQGCIGVESGNVVFLCRFGQFMNDNFTHAFALPIFADRKRNLGHVLVRLQEIFPDGDDVAKAELSNNRNYRKVGNVIDLGDTFHFFPEKR